MVKAKASHMGVGRGRFRKALRAVLLARHSTPNLEALVREELPWECAYCGIPGDQERLQLDHLWPEAQAGCRVLGNVVPSCPTCNSDRRDVPWQEFLEVSSRVRGGRSEDAIKCQIQKIASYMQRHGRDVQPDWDSTLTIDERQLLMDFDLLLSAISDGALAKAGHMKKSCVMFDSPTVMFDQIVELVRTFSKSQK